MNSNKRVKLKAGNKKIKKLRKLHMKKYRRKEQSFLIEGVRLIEDAIDAGAEITQAFFSNELYNRPRGEKLLVKMEAFDFPVFELDNKILTEVSDTENPQGVLAVSRIPELKNKEISAFLDSAELLVLADRIRDPGNLGTLIRTAAAASADGILYVSGTVDPYNPKVLRASMGSLFRIPCIFLDAFMDGSITNSILNLKEKGFSILAADPDADTYHFEADLTSPSVLIMGSEAEGITDEILYLSDLRLKVPLAHNVESLNVAAAGAVILFEAVRQKIIS